METAADVARASTDNARTADFFFSLLLAVRLRFDRGVTSTSSFSSRERSSDDSNACADFFV